MEVLLSAIEIITIRGESSSGSGDAVHAGVRQKRAVNSNTET
jgi:hypothetical protein